MIELTLFSAAQCCLCDEALSLLNSINSASSDRAIELKKVNINTDKQLLVKYRTLIPVLRHGESGKELNWPFDEERYLAWLAALE